MASSSTMSARKTYLTAFNLLFAALWFNQVFLTALLHARDNQQSIFDKTEYRARCIQTASLIEVVHAAVGSYKMYTYMMKQRRKTLRGEKKRA
ncbi:hypothetical protein ACEQ8H_002795 [Pleosporales sp. CAS-2024a]